MITDAIKEIKFKQGINRLLKQVVKNHALDEEQVGILIKKRKDKIAIHVYEGHKYIDTIATSAVVKHFR